jgi:hypothetical protein
MGINYIPKSYQNGEFPVGADLCVCPEFGIGDVTDRKWPHGGDLGEHMGSPLRGGIA